MTEPIEQEAGVLEHLDPRTLVLETNVRVEASLTKQFIASIKENGVMVPVTAVRGADGTVQVRTGQRRTLAAREAGLTSIPVYITDAGDDTASRLFEQIAENDQRAQLSTLDRVHGIQQLLDTGLSVTKVAKRLAVSAERVKASKAVAASQTALDALANKDRPVTLAEAAVIAEFDGDPDAQERLLSMAGYGSFEHHAQRLRQQREDNARRAAAAQEWAAKGFTVLDQRPSSHDANLIPIYDLTTTDGEDVEDSVVDDHDPAWWAVYLFEDEVFRDKETGERVDEEDVDWATDNEPDTEPEDGLRHANTVVSANEWTPEYYCLDHVAAKLKPTERFARYSGMVARGEASGDGSAPGTRADELAQKRAAAKLEAEKEERRRVVPLNKAGLAAEAVRRKFVTQLLTRKTPPKGAATFVARTLAADAYLLSYHKAEEITIELLGANPRSYTAAGHEPTGGVAEMLEQSSEGRAQVITLGLVLGALESRTPKDAWRDNRSVTGLAMRYAGAKQYLEFLEANGYTLSAVEEIVVGKKTAEEVYDELKAQ